MSASTEPIEPAEPVQERSRLVAVTRAGRRRTVVAFGSALVLTAIAGAMPDAPVLTLLGILASLGIGVLVRASIGSTADLPDEQLDERLVAERNVAYLGAYRLIATMFVLVAVTADLLHVRFDIAPLLGAMLPVAPPLVLFAPSAYIAWHRAHV
jgi:hypothetical protein